MENHLIYLEVDNYAEWSARMKKIFGALLGHLKLPGKKVVKTILEALHVIWNYCGEKAFSVAKGFRHANDVWYRLAKRFALLDRIRKDNFLDWSARMKCYLIAKDLWSVVDPRQEDNEFSSKDTKVKDLEALQVIRRFYGLEALSMINECDTARDTWNVFITKYDVKDGIKLEGDNYANWSDRVKFSLMNQQLRNIVEPSTEPTEMEDPEKFKIWYPRNSDALEVIRSSCRWEAFFHIFGIKMAQEAWNTLAERYGMRDRIDKGKDLVDAVRRGEWITAKECLEKHPHQERHKITSREETALHIAVAAEQTEIVDKLAQVMSKKDLEIVDVEGYTAFAHAAILGKHKLVEYILRKNENLIHFEGVNRCIPVVLAIQYGHKDLAWYLYKRTSLKFLKRGKGIHGATVCTQAIQNGMLDLLQKHPPFAHAVDLDRRSPLYALASTPDAFSSINQPVFSKPAISFALSFYSSFKHSG